MDEKELRTAMFTIAIFALGAVAIILYQHSLHTGQIVGAINGNNPAPGRNQSQAQFTGFQANPSAGGATPGQDNLVPNNVSVDLLTAGANYQFGG